MEYLNTLLEGVGPGARVVEIGYYEGQGSTRVFLEYIEETGGSLYSLDLFDSQQAYDKAAAQFNGYDATPLRGYSVEVGTSWDKKPVDFIFIDGDHGFPRITDDGMQSGVALDIVVWHDHLRVGGIMAFHDYTGNERTYGEESLIAVEQAVDSLCREPFYEFIGRDESIIAFRKKFDGVLYPFHMPKKAPAACEGAWDRLNQQEMSPRILIWGMGSAGKQVKDAVLAVDGDTEIRFTSNHHDPEMQTFQGCPVIPKEDAVGFQGDVIIGSIYENEISEQLRGMGLVHLEHFYRYHEFMSWIHIGRLACTHAATK